MQNYLEDYYKTMNDPYWQQGQISQRFNLMRPQVSALMNRGYAGLARRGLFSTGPVSQYQSDVYSNLSSNIGSNFFNQLDQNRIPLLQVLAQMREAEIERKRQQKAALWGGIGSLFGTALNFIPGYGNIDDIAKMFSNQGSTPYIPQNYQPYQMPFSMNLNSLE